MDFASNLPILLPLACEWAKEQSDEIQSSGMPLNSEGIDVAMKVGVKHPEKVRVLEVSSLPLPENLILREAAISTGLIGPDMVGLTLGHSIYICSGHMTKCLLSHELRHVHQYEVFESIEGFLTEYLSQIVTYGYTDSPLEVDARSNEIHT